ncbi:hypothetical protein GGX14DRAFT_428404 [Mycena pura]|uniref:GTP binding protein 2 n=1 Tax=Mycena pura TaxID=153505 RepID=A0AAD6YKR7_9AGAR|nr:hypothetical protein GGX14DRAFT_428404 [Mycena pura]
MFGESDSESPRVPSPWDPFISTPPSPSPSPSPRALPHLSSIPKLVPEQDDGNVEYKLQLLSPSPARFARLVTQMKWRLLEGGGQAYYELGVADSGMLVGLPRAELEQSLETLEMMAGEIGASVIVVKEIEVPAAMIGLVATQANPSSWTGKPKPARQRQALLVSDGNSPESGSADDATATNEGDMSATDVEDDVAAAIFSMDDLDSASTSASEIDADGPASLNHFSIDLEIASVYKPRPVRTKASTHGPLPTKKSGRALKVKKGAHLPGVLAPPPATAAHNSAAQKPTKGQNRRAARDRRREERRLELLHGHGTAEARSDKTRDEGDRACANADADAAGELALVENLEALHVAVSLAPEPGVAIPVHIPVIELSADAGPAPEIDADAGEDDEDDVFPSPWSATPGPAPFPGFSSYLTVTVPVDNGDAHKHEAGDGPQTQPRLIVEALVVRKMSLEEAFLDFGGFSLT